MGFEWSDGGGKDWRDRRDRRDRKDWKDWKGVLTGTRGEENRPE